MTRAVMGHSRGKGMALIAVLWIVAVLGIIVTGMGYAVRNEVRLVSGARQSVVAEAAGDAAIHLVLQEMVAAVERPMQLTNVTVTYKNQPISVLVLPLNGLIDINNAPQALLVSMFSVGGQVAPDLAAALAQATVETRTRKDGVGQPEGFDAIEDMLRVPGLTYTVYANISKLITADRPGSGKVNPMAAPEGVLRVLAGGNAGRAGSIAADRDAGRTGIDTTTTLTSEYTDNAATQRFKLQARVPLPDGASLLISRSVDLEDGVQDGLPWRTFHTEQRFESALGQGQLN